VTRRALTTFAVTLVALTSWAWSWRDADVTSDLRVTSCSWFGEYYRRVAELGEDRTHWRVDTLPDRIGGWVDTKTDVVTISPATPCDLVHDVVTHEWAHLLQVAYYGDWDTAYAVGGATRLEREADCVSYLMGSHYTPYVGIPGGGVTCTPDELFWANELLKSHSDLIRR